MKDWLESNNSNISFRIPSQVNNSRSFSPISLFLNATGFVLAKLLRVFLRKPTVLKTGPFGRPRELGIATFKFFGTSLVLEFFEEREPILFLVSQSCPCSSSKIGSSTIASALVSSILFSVFNATELSKSNTFDASSASLSSFLFFPVRTAVFVLAGIMTSFIIFGSWRLFVCLGLFVGDRIADSCWSLGSTLSYKTFYF